MIMIIRKCTFKKMCIFYLKKCLLPKKIDLLEIYDDMITYIHIKIAI